MRKSRIDSDPELKAAMAGHEEEFIERIKQGYRDRLAREAREARRRGRLRRLTFGLLGR